jgi:hypothetical protein
VNEIYDKCRPSDGRRIWAIDDSAEVVRARLQARDGSWETGKLKLYSSRADQHAYALSVMH